MQTPGQWSPIAGTCMAALGSLYVYWTEGENFVTYGGQEEEHAKPNSSHSDPSETSKVSMEEPCSPTQVSHTFETAHRPSNEGTNLQPTVTITGADDDGNSVHHIEDVNNANTRPAPEAPPIRKSITARSVVRNRLDRISSQMSETAHRELDTREHKNKKAYKYPMSPGEDLKNEQFHETSEQYKKLRIQRVNSSASSIRSSNGEGPSTTPAGTTPGPMRPRTNTDPDAIRPVVRKDTLEVPEAAYHSP
jgi:hypothetical protein